MHKKKTTPRRRPKKTVVRRQRNPSRVTSKATDLVKMGAFALGGLVLARQIPQAVLGGRNSGFVGYLANALTAIVAAAIISKYGGKPAGNAVGIGGGLYVVQRVMDEQFTALGRQLSLSGVGDSRASGSLRGIGPAYFPWPVATDRAGNPIIPPQIDNAQIAAPATVAAGVGRFAGRF